MLDQDLLSKVKHIQLRARSIATETMAGEYHSAFRGQGIEFDELREYVPGDDIRAIDWKVTARMDHPYVKVFKEEREQTVMLLVDVSRSQEFSGHHKLKREVAAEFAAVIAFLATHNNDKVGLLLFSDKVEKFIPPKKGRGHIWNIIRTVLTFESTGEGTDISSSLNYFARVIKRKAMCFVISDFIEDDFMKTFATIKRKHDLIAVNIVDPLEEKLPAVGLIEIEDSESGSRAMLNLTPKRTREEFESFRIREISETQKEFQRYGIDFVKIGTHQDISVPIERLMKLRESRRS